MSKLIEVEMLAVDVHRYGPRAATLSVACVVPDGPDAIRLKAQIEALVLVKSPQKEQEQK